MSSESRGLERKQAVFQKQQLLFSRSLCVSLSAPHLPCMEDMPAGKKPDPRKKGQKKVRLLEAWQRIPVLSLGKGRGIPQSGLRASCSWAHLRDSWEQMRRPGDATLSRFYLTQTPLHRAFLAPPNRADILGLIQLPKEASQRNDVYANWRNCADAGCLLMNKESR